MSIFNFKSENKTPHYLVGKSQSDIIQEIHKAFDTEVEILLESAKIKLEPKPIEPSLKNKSEALLKLGFRKSKPVWEAEAVHQENMKTKLENKKRDLLIETINYFSMKYPNYKFITEESVIKICEKYFLVYADVEHYIGNVPEKNIQDMLNFKINPEDAAYESYSMWGSRNIISYSDIDKSYKEVDVLRTQSRLSIMEQQMLTGIYSAPKTEYRKCNFAIAAPANEFDRTGLVQNGYSLERAPIKIDDPVVLQPVRYKGVTHFLVVTAWGLEASDELVVNQKMN